MAQKAKKKPAKMANRNIGSNETVKDDGQKYAVVGLNGKADLPGRRRRAQRGRAPSHVAGGRRRPGPHRARRLADPRPPGHGDRDVPAGRLGAVYQHDAGPERADLDQLEPRVGLLQIALSGQQRRRAGHLGLHRGQEEGGDLVVSNLASMACPG